MFTEAKEKTKEKVEDIKSTARDLKDDAKESASKAQDQLKAVAREAGEHMQDYLHNKKEQLDEARQTAERTIQEHPLTTMLAAFATGVLVTSLLKRK